jgi:hypothetical protein
LLGSYLDKTKAIRGDYEALPFRMTVEFLPYMQFQYHSLVQKKHYVQTLQEYLEQVLGRPVQVELLLQEQSVLDASGATPVQRPNFISTSPRQLFQEDLEKEPILKKLVEIFQADYKYSSKPQKESEQ